MGSYENSFGGSIEGIPDIRVDNFTEKNKKAYFLSHMHSDHTGGLIGINNSFKLACSLKKNNGKIYMTKETKIIFRHKYKNDYTQVKKFLVVLKTGEPHDLDDLQLKVTLIPVTHMPGAVMFLFNTQEGKTILYTGDFVFNSEDLKNYKALHGSDDKPIAIDLVYYDASFDNDVYRHKRLPDTTKCIEDATSLIKEWLLEKPENAVAIRIPYIYGSEGLLAGIVGKLQAEDGETKEKLGNFKIYMNDLKGINIYRKILKDTDDVYTTEESRIHLCKNYKMDDHALCFTGAEDEQTKCSTYLKIAVSTLNWTPPANNSPVKKLTTPKTPKNYFEMCYPTHCSRDKLDEFMEYFNPTVSVPFAVKSCLTTKRRKRKITKESTEAESSTDDHEAFANKLAELSL